MVALAWTLLSVGPFILGAHVEPDLQSARLLYFATASACLLLASVAAAPPRVSSVAGVAIYVSVCLATLSTNLRPWVYSGETMRRVTATYGGAFGWYEGEPIEKLPERHQGAYIGLFNAACMSRPFVLGPPKRDAAARYRAVYDATRGDLNVLPDPVFGAGERFRRDQGYADWLFPLDTTKLNASQSEYALSR